MSGFLYWFLICYFAFNAVFAVALVNRRQKPITPATAAIMVVFYGLLITVIAVWGAAR